MKKFIDLIAFAVLLLLVIVLPKGGALNTVVSALAMASAIYSAAKWVLGKYAKLGFFTKLP